MTTIHGFMKTTKLGVRKQASIKTIPIELDSEKSKILSKKDAVKLFRFLMRYVPSNIYSGLKRLITLYETMLATRVYEGDAVERAITQFMLEKSN